mmetsp:Transcript_63620/g.170413  ORF Transcript_63620/g.170413 Transcript_63620/m.170413 type:complete len:282 (+) Transcript_63620:3060-3905(+)
MNDVGVPQIIQLLQACQRRPIAQAHDVVPLRDRGLHKLFQRLESPNPVGAVRTPSLAQRHPPELRVRPRHLRQVPLLANHHPRPGLSNRVHRCVKHTVLHKLRHLQRRVYPRKNCNVRSVVLHYPHHLSPKLLDPLYHRLLLHRAHAPKKRHAFRVAHEPSQASHPGLGRVRGPVVLGQGLQGQGGQAVQVHDEAEALFGELHPPGLHPLMVPSARQPLCRWGHGADVGHLSPLHLRQHPPHRLPRRLPHNQHILAVVVLQGLSEAARHFQRFRLAPRRIR